jgi:hypothetical protein
MASMKIKIAQKLAPFSFLCGSRALIPSTTYEVKVFPVKLEFYNREKSSQVPDLEIFLEIKGPLKKFIVFQDIERAYIEISAFSKEGFIRYKIKHEDGKLAIFLEKAPKEELEIRANGKKEFLRRKIDFYLPLKTRFLDKKRLELLSFGIHKAQDIEKIKRRGSLNEIFPLWFGLGQLIPKDKRKVEGMALLLEKSLSLISEGKKEEVEAIFLTVFHGAFYSLFSPSLSDELHQGIIDEKEEIEEGASPLILLERGYEIIRSMFIVQKENKVALLPFLLPIFHAGRMINLKLEGIGYLDLEWSKKLLKKVILYAESDMVIQLQLQKPIKSFRIRRDLREKGALFVANNTIQLEKDKIYYFDRFQK